MTINYGSLVGAKKQLVPPTPVASTLENGTDHVLIRDTVELAAAQIGDSIELVHNLPWETVLAPDACTMYFDALGASTTLSVGEAGAHVAALAVATSTSSAGSLNMLKTVDIANYGQPLWKLLGYATLAAAKAVSVSCVLLATLAGGAATGTVSWTMKGQRR